MENGEAELLCPFHEESTPSFGINLTSGMWHCFGCNQSGNLEKFVMRMGNLDILHAKLLIRQLRGKAPELKDGLDLDKVMEKEPIQYDVGEVWARFQEIDWMNASLDWPVARYLIKERGFSRLVLDAFDVRLTQDPFYPIAIQIRRKGELMGYVRRLIRDEVDPNTGKKLKKYRFNTGMDLESTLAYYKVGDEPCVITEGMLDYMLCAQYEIQHAASILTWGMKKPQADWLLDNGVREVICATDNTPTGDDGFKVMTELMKGARVRRLAFPGKTCKDVGEMNVNEFRKAIRDTITE